MILYIVCNYMYSFSFPYQTAEWVYSVWNIAFCPKMTWFFRKNRFFFDFLYIWNQFELLIPKMDDNLGPSGSNRLSHTQTSHIAGSRQQSYSFFRLSANYLWNLCRQGCVSTRLDLEGINFHRYNMKKRKGILFHERNSSLKNS